MKSNLIPGCVDIRVKRCNKKRERKMAKKYNFKLCNTVNRMIKIYFVVGLWKKNTGNKMASLLQLFYFVSFFLFGVSIVVEAYLTDNNDDCILLIVTTLVWILQLGRLYNIIWKQNRILDLIRKASANSTNDFGTFCVSNVKLNKLMFLATYFMVASYFSVVAVTALPLIRKALIFDIAFPLDYKNSETGFYAAYVFVAGISFVSITSMLFVCMLWFVMLNIVVKYEILGNDFENLGKVRTEDDEERSCQSLYFQNLIRAMESLESINCLVEEFASNFSYLFLLQIVTSSICICGMVYTLAFSSHANLGQDGFYLIVIFFCFFDTFAPLYLGNEIMLASNRLSYCLFKSQWMDQTKLCIKSILILVERLKQPQQLVVGKVFPMNLQMFTVIVNRAYSMFNILQKLRQ